MRFGQKLAKLRNSMGWSQERLHEILGDISKSKISDWEVGRFQPNRIEVARLADLFGVDVEYLVRDEVEHPHRSETTPEQKMILRVVGALNLSLDDVIRGLNLVSRPEPPSKAGESETLSERNLSAERAAKLADGGKKKRGD